MAVTVESKTLFVGLLVGLAHMASGVAVMVSPPAGKVVALASLHDIVVGWFGFGVPFLGLVLIGAGLLAVIGASQSLATMGLARIMLFVPQEILLLLQIWSISTSLAFGVYPDGYSPIGSAWFILADQVWAWVLSISHSLWLAALIYGRSTSGKLY